jgi:oligopeptidase B
LPNLNDYIIVNNDVLATKIEINGFTKTGNQLEVLVDIKKLTFQDNAGQTYANQPTKVIVKEKGIKPKAQLVYVYGAYGSTTPVGWTYGHWYPLLKRKWALVFALVRGGGDIDAAWAEMARRQNRHLSIEDFEAVIRASQTKNKLGPEETVIYGRSAGGLLMGGTMAEYPDGSLMGAVYAEVPYVDELRTTTNPELPLTALEYNEFGAPSLRLEDFIQVAQLSPADTAASTAFSNLLVIARTAENDSQVFAYESVKWIRRLREHSVKGAPKICLIEQDQGHFTPPEKTVAQWAIDAAILDAWVNSELQ